MLVLARMVTSYCFILLRKIKETHHTTEKDTMYSMLCLSLIYFDCIHAICSKMFRNNRNETVLYQWRLRSSSSVQMPGLICILVFGLFSIVFCAVSHGIAYLPSPPYRTVNIVPIHAEPPNTIYRKCNHFRPILSKKLIEKAFAGNSTTARRKKLR